MIPVVYNAIIPNKRNNSDFIYYLMEKHSSIVVGLAGQTATPILNKKAFSEIKILIPVSVEQQKIAKFLSTLDKKIEIEVLEHRKQIKKGLLQKMFV